MSILIHHITRTAGGGIERTEQVIEGDVVTIGRATDQHLHIPDRTLPLQHSVIRDQGEYLQIRANAGAILFVNEERTSSARLHPGDLIEISNWRILVSDPPAGSSHKYYLRVEPGEALSEEDVDLGAQFKTSLDQTRLSKRAPSWLLVLLITASGLLLPGAAMLLPGLQDALHTTPFGDRQWDTGPLHPSHRFIYGAGQKGCRACHVEAFEHAPDEACVACHRFVEHHVDVTVHEIPELEGRRCASCHEEHHEPQALIRRDQEHCTGCHADLGASTTGPTDLRNVGDFYDDHPEFKVTTLVPSGRGKATSWRIERVALDDPDLMERSNLKFPHDIHLDPGGIDSPERGRIVMDCKDCHHLESGGMYLEPVSMERDCAECHELTFDASEPHRQVPHGDTEAVMEMLREFYARKVLESGGQQSAASSRRPGRGRRQRSEAVQQPSAPVARTVNTVEVLAEADDRARAAAAAIFEQRTCAICHQISEVDDPDAPVPWAVDPVRLTRIWMPKSWFDHEAHATYECDRCHVTVINSTESSEVNMPGIGICRDCHGGEDTPGLLGSSCIDCHRFHIPGLEVMKPEVPGAITRAEAKATMPIREARTALSE